MKAGSHEEFAALIGIDWADRRHAVCLQVSGTAALEFSTCGWRKSQPTDVRALLLTLPWPLP